MTPFDVSAGPPQAKASPAGANPERRRARVEIPTLLLIVATYVAWLAITFLYARWPLIVVAPIGAALLTLHGSVQHEIVHGHPTVWRPVNRLLAMVPLALWLPYDRYRALHHRHHIDARLTDPLDDPETFYWRRADLAHFKTLTRALLAVQQTLAGRVLLGSFWRIGMFWHADWRALRANEPGVRAAWLEHLLWCAPVILWLQWVCGLPLWIYMLTMVIPSYGLTLVRAFAEHRARPGVRERIAVVEDSWILGPLFLFNNLHSLHHEAPAIPWYELPARYRRERERLIRDNGGLVYCTYFEVMRRYLFRAHDSLEHPSDRVPLTAR